MKKILDIYADYKIMPNLEEHMFRVAAVASLICDNFKEPLPKKEIISACLLHDLGNIVKFNLELTRELFNVKEEDLPYWHNVQKEFIEKYGEDDHLATFLICKELNIKGKVFELVENTTSGLGEGKSVGEDMSALVCEYSDFRVGPRGILDLEKRFFEWKARNQRVDPVSVEYTHILFQETEKKIFQKCTLKPEDITDEAINSIIPKLRDFVIE